MSTKQPYHVHAQAAANASGGSSSAVPKILMGCGCVVAVMVGIVVLVFVAGGMFVAKTVSDNKEEFGEFVQTAKELGEQAKELQRLGEEAKKRRSELDARGLSAADEQNLLEAVERPLASDDVPKHIAFMKDFEGKVDTAELKRAGEVLRNKAELERGGGDGDVGDAIKVLTESTKLMVSVTKAMQQFEIAAAEHGGSVAVMGRLFRVISIAAAADAVSREHAGGAPAYGAKVAGELAKQREDYAPYYEAFELAAKEYAQRADNDDDIFSGDQEAMERAMREMAEQTQTEEGKRAAELYGKEPGLLLLGAMDEATLDAWKNTSEDERQLILEKYAKLPALPVLAMLPEELFSTQGTARVVLNMRRAKFTDPSAEGSR